MKLLKELTDLPAFGQRVDDQMRKWVQKMYNALEDDFWNYDSDFQHWAEFGLENPSNTVSALWDEVPEEQQDEYEDAYEQILDRIERENDDFDE